MRKVMTVHEFKKILEELERDGFSNTPIVFTGTTDWGNYITGVQKLKFPYHYDENGNCVKEEVEVIDVIVTRESYCSHYGW